MSKIVGKLNLNKNPQDTENTSLIFSKNIKLLEDGSISADSAVADINAFEPFITRVQTSDTQAYRTTEIKVIGHIVGLDNKVYLFIEVLGWKNTGTKIYSTHYYIGEYNEDTNTSTKINSGWTYSGGKITGCVTKNVTNETILTICEYDTNVQVPIKHINLATCQSTDDESIYTQNPNIPISNLLYEGTYKCNIPAGVYQFFIRYNIKDSFYTNWFPCSKELFAGSKTKINTVEGTLRYTDKHVDANESFVLRLENLFDTYNSNFVNAQIGFILSCEEGNVARIWKTVELNSNSTVNLLYFDYKDVKEINIDDILYSGYELYDVKNVTNFDNKLYIANYKESNFNEDLGSYASQIQVNINRHNIPINNDITLNGMAVHQYGDSDTYDKLDNIDIKEYYYGAETRNSTRSHLGTNRYFYYIKINNIVYKYVGKHLNYDCYEEVSDITHEINTSYIANIKVDLTGETPYTLLNSNEIPDIDLSATHLNEVNLSNTSIITKTNNNILNRIKDKIKYIQKTNNSDYSFYGDVSETETPNIVSFYNINVEYVNYEVTKLYNKYSTIYLRTGTNPDYIYSIFILPNDITIQYKKYYGQDTLHSLFNNPVIVNSTYDNVYSEYNTLVPFTSYSFYAHYVKQNGIITNGYYINSIEEFNAANFAERVSINDINAIVFDRNRGVSNDSILGHNNETTDDNLIYYPSFSNIDIPSGYVACFISIYKHQQQVAKGFNYKYVETDSDNHSGIHYLDCIEADTLLYNLTSKDIKIINYKGDVIINNARYYPSGSSENLDVFSYPGVIVWEGSEITFGANEDESSYFYIVCDDNDSFDNNNPLRLTKLTPYIKTTHYDDFNNLNIPGYLCKVSKLDREILKDYYINSGTIYELSKTKVSIDEGLVDNNLPTGTTITDLEQATYNYYYEHALERFISYNNYESSLRELPDNKTILIRSNYNLNYLSLSQDLTPQLRQFEGAIRTISTSGGVSTNVVYRNADDKSVSITMQQMLVLIESLISSTILTLESYYKDYTKKLFNNYRISQNNITTFNNTIRISNVIKDEVHTGIYIFNSETYKHIPSNRGIIINLFAISKSLYIHVEHSLFKYTASSKLNSTDGANIEVSTAEILENTVSEVYDSNVGYAGLAKKEHSIVTYDYYLFYDALVNRIYAYCGDSKIAVISDGIKKLLDSYKPDNVIFAYDEHNDRILINLKKNLLLNNNSNSEETNNSSNQLYPDYDENTNICLSFNMKHNAFVSIHDLNFVHAFNTRTRCYLCNPERHANNSHAILTTDVEFICNNPFYITNSGILNYKALYKDSHLKLTETNADLEDRILSSVDILVNTQYEKVKVLNHIKWICKKLNGYYDNLSINLAEETDEPYAGSYIRIYTDSTYTDLLRLIDSNNLPIISNKSSISNVTFDRYPRNNKGVWSWNYFRDVENTTDTFNYRNTTLHPELSDIQNQFDITPYTQRNNLTNENSLIYGKYFVVRIIFDRNFKLENLTLNMSDYE